MPVLPTEWTLRCYRLRRDGLAWGRDVLSAAFASNDEVVRIGRGLEHAGIIGE